MSLPPYLGNDQLVRDRLRAVRLAVEARVAIERGELTDPDAVRDLEAQIAARSRATQGAGRQWPIDQLRDRLGLTASEDRLLWLLLAIELDARTRTLVRALATETALDLTIDVARRVVYGDDASVTTWDELAVEAPLFALGLVDRVGTDIPDHRQTLRLDRRVLALVHGKLGLDPDLAAVADLPGTAPEPSQIAVAGDALERVRSAMARGGLVLVTGPTGVGRRTLLHAVAGEAGREVLVVDARELATEPEPLMRQLRAIRRECLLHDRVPLVRHVEALAGEGKASRLAVFDRRLVSASPLVLATASRLPAVRWSKSPAIIQVDAPTSVERARVWGSSLPGIAADDTRRLASMFPLAPSLIRSAANAALQRRGEGALSREQIAEGIRSVLDDRVGDLATRIAVTQTWDDLVLGGDQLEAVVELLARIRERGTVFDDWGFARKLGKGLGTAALFSGPPGTGKSMVAGLIARDLGLEVYQADVSKLTSKWIGETEKNLAELFDAAEAGHSVLLFDEADSMFAKRTEVTSSNDRHANVVVNYLLQRLESFTGVCILTTNYEQTIDDAFRRRLALHLRFEVPGPSERLKLWAAMLPAEAPVAPELDLAPLASQFVMAGGHIRNAVLRAAFLAADEGRPISAHHLARGARLEYEAMGKLA